MTKKQGLILQLVKECEGHLSADDLYMLCKKKKIDVSIASTYRILNKLSQDGLIRKVSNIGNKDVYDKFTYNHEHLVCSKCGKIVDINIKDFKNKLEKLAGVNIDTYDLCIHYVCDDCKKLK